jgi:hypothetical protein
MKMCIAVLAVVLLTGCVGALYQDKYDALYQRCMEVKRDSAKCEELVFEERWEDQRAYQPGGIVGPQPGPRVITPPQQKTKCYSTFGGGVRCYRY